MTPLSEIEVVTEALYLDPNNPRFADLQDRLQSVPPDRITEQGVQAKALTRILDDRFEVKQLKDSIRTIGFLTVDRLVVSRLPEEGKYLVIEGNRRLGAIRALLEGSLVHGLLEHAMRHKNSTREDLSRLAMWLTFEQQELRPVVDEAVAVVEAFTRSEFWELASRSDHLVEVPFLFAEAQDSLLSGIIDLVFKNRDGWEIVDYKTDVDLDENKAEQKYKYQLDAYRRALTSCGVENVSASIRSVRTGIRVTEMNG